MQHLVGVEKVRTLHDIITQLFEPRFLDEHTIIREQNYEKINEV